MIIYEAYNSVESVEFLTEAEAQQYATPRSMSFRPKTQDIQPFEHVLTRNDWFNLEQELYNAPDILPKALNSVGNGFAFFTKVLSDGKGTGASENALQLALSVLLPTMVVPYTDSEKSLINSVLEQNNFKTRIL